MINPKRLPARPNQCQLGRFPSIVEIRFWMLTAAAKGLAQGVHTASTLVVQWWQLRTGQAHGSSPVHGMHLGREPSEVKSCASESTGRQNDCAAILCLFDTMTGDLRTKLVPGEPVLPCASSEPCVRKPCGTCRPTHRH